MAADSVAFPPLTEPACILTVDVYSEWRPEALRGPQSLRKYPAQFTAPNFLKQERQHHSL